MKRVNWYTSPEGEILNADYLTNQAEFAFQQDGEEEEPYDPAYFDQPEAKPAPPKVDPELVITHTGEVLYIGQEDDITGRRYIKFVVKDSEGWVWSLLPQQIRYIIL